jgi:hypothetical protein
LRQRGCKKRTRPLAETALYDKRLAPTTSGNTAYLRGVVFVRKPYKTLPCRWTTIPSRAGGLRSSDRLLDDTCQAVNQSRENHSRRIHDHAEFVRGAGDDWACLECFTLFREPDGLREALVGGKSRSHASGVALFDLSDSAPPLERSRHLELALSAALPSAMALSNWPRFRQVNPQRLCRESQSLERTGTYSTPVECWTVFIQGETPCWQRFSCCGWKPLCGR